MDPSPGHDLAGAALPGFRSFASRSTYYSLGSVAQKAVGLLLIPALARVLTRTEFGHVEVLSTLATSVTSVLLLGLDVVVTRRWADVGPAERRTTVGTWLAVAVALGALGVGALAVAAAPLSRALVDTDRLAPGIRVAGLFALANLIFVCSLTTLRNQDRARAYAGISVVTALANGVLVAGLTIVYRSEVAVIAGIAGAAALGAAAATLATRGAIGRPTGVEGRILVMTALPLVPGLVLTWGGDLVNRTILLTTTNAVEVGYLSIALRFGTLGLLVVTGFQLAWHPRAYAIAQRPGGLERIANDGALILLSVSTLTAAVAVASPELLRLVAGSKFDDALPAVGMALLLPLTMALLLLTTLPSALGNRMSEIGAATTVAAAATIGLTIALADGLGAVGAAIAQAGGPVLGAGVGVWAARQSGPWIDFDWLRTSVVALATASVALLSTNDDLSLGPPERAGLAVAFALVVIGLERHRLGAIARPMVAKLRA